MPQPSPELLDGDFESIAAAVQETPRGRWFLDEYARRNRQADTKMLLGAIARLEKAVRGDGAAPGGHKMRASLLAIAERIAQTKTEVAEARLDAGQRRAGNGADVFEAVVPATKSATSDILLAAERVQETAWTLREQGFKAETCDFLDAQATDIYTACSFQDLASQQTHKIVDLLRHFESRLSAMVELWGSEAEPGSAAAAATEAASSLDDDNGLATTSIEAITPDAPPVAPADTFETSVADHAEAAHFERQPHRGGDDINAALDAMSAEEKIALFT